jgi:cell division septation protein DedD
VPIVKRTWKTWHLAVGCLIALLFGIGIGGASRDKPQAAGITVVTVPVTEPGAASKPSVTTTATVPKATTTTAPATTTTQRPATTTAPPTTTTRAPSETVSQKNARQKAGEYLSYTSFSRSGLISQLRFEGFTQAEAEHGVSATGL